MRQDVLDLRQYALCLVQALCGVISDNFRFVSITKRASEISIRIILQEPSDDDLDEIEDLKTEFEALLPGPTDYEITVDVSQMPIEWPSVDTIVVFKRRE